MKSVNKILTIFASACFTLSSCDIDPVLTSSYPDDITWSNETNLQLYINGFYSLIGGYYSITDDACADLLKANNPAANTNLFVFGSTPITSASNLFDNWNNRHSWQLTCCRALEGLEKHRENFTEEVAKRAEAEFRFFRAVANFDLAKRYGASFILYKQLPELGQKDHARCTPDECWDFIAEDLDFAAKNLPLRGTVEAGKLTSGAAYGMKARAMLYAERWKDASDAAAELKKQGYELYEDYGKLFLNRRAKPVANNESVIEFGYVYETLDYSFDYFNCPPSDGGYAEISPTETLVSAYQMADGKEFDWNNPDHRTKALDPLERDPRLAQTVLMNGQLFKGRRVESFTGGMNGLPKEGASPTSYYLRKHLKEDTDLTTGSATSYQHIWPLFRYAEVLLNYAEALLEATKEPDFKGIIDNVNYTLSPREAVNMVRARVDMNPIGTAGYDAFKKRLRNERRMELAFEGHRFWDIRRWKIGSSTTKLEGLAITAIENENAVEGEDMYTYSYVKKTVQERIWEDRMNYYPIQDTELFKNHNLIQNDGWDGN